MFDANNYIRTEFRRYFPDADRIDVHFDETSEIWTVGVVTMGGAHIRNYEMEVGSDDDYFWFVNKANGNPITVPYAPEQYS
jgi:capsule polysaccharide export protein KpsE/RkpR